MAQLVAGSALAEAWFDVGDGTLRHDLEFLVDGNVIDLPLGTWPIPSVDVARALRAVRDRSNLTPAQLASVERIERRIDRFSRDSFGADVRVAGAARPIQLRTFEDSPREEGELEVSLHAEGTRFSGRLRVTGVADPDDDHSVRLDGTYGTMRLGNWLLTAGAMDRWWGPGWDHSLLLSNNARPVPALSLDRESSTPFESKWLSWIGPWRLSTFMGKMEDHREDRDHPLLFGMRINFRPLSNIEIGSMHPFDGIEFGLERTAEWCGEGLPCGAQAFWNVFAGHDNAGETVNPNDEPGNQLAGWTLRWASPFPRLPLAVYRQKTGETIDLHSPLPRRTLDMYGAESWGGFSNGASWRLAAEYADTACSHRAGETLPAFDCAYNNALFNVEGYRFRGRSMGDSADGDAIVRSVEMRWVSPSEWQLELLFRSAELNRGGTIPDTLNTVAPEPTRLREVESVFSTTWRGSDWRLGLGVEEREPLSTGRQERAVRGFLEWRLRL